LAFIALIGAASVIVSCGEAASTAANFEYTGIVRDSETREPLEGAYVVAGYRKVVSGPAATRSWCVKTRGMYTDKDGKFHFPVENLDGSSPASASAIKPDYFRGSSARPDPDEWRKQTAKAYANRDIYLHKQEPSTPTLLFGYGDEDCDHAATRQDAEAGVQFMKIEQAEKIKYGAPKNSIDAGWRVIQRYESLPSNSSSAPANSVGSNQVNRQ
jgi:hypothetical protein